MRHLRAAEICRDARDFFYHHGLDWRDFVLNGIPVEIIENIGDPIALRAAEEARKEHTDGRG